MAKGTENNLKAYCTSFKCAPTPNGFIAKVEKNVPARTMSCPDCKNILIWKKPGTQTHSVHQRGPRKAAGKTKLS